MIKENKEILIINFLIALMSSLLLLFSESFSLNNILLNFIFLSFLMAGIFSGFLFSFKERINFISILKLALINGIFFGVSSILLALISPIAEKIATKAMVSVYIGMSASDESNSYIYLAKSATKGFFWVTLFFTATSYVGIYMRNKIDIQKTEE